MGKGSLRKVEELIILGKKELMKSNCRSLCWLEGQSDSSHLLSATFSELGSYSLLLEKE